MQATIKKKNTVQNIYCFFLYFINAESNVETSLYICHVLSHSFDCGLGKDRRHRPRSRQSTLDPLHSH